MMKDAGSRMGGWLEAGATKGSAGLRPGRQVRNEGRVSRSGVGMDERGGEHGQGKQSKIKEAIESYPQLKITVIFPQFIENKGLMQFLPATNFGLSPPRPARRLLEGLPAVAGWAFHPTRI